MSYMKMADFIYYILFLCSCFFVFFLKINRNNKMPLFRNSCVRRCILYNLSFHRYLYLFHKIQWSCYLNNSLKCMINSSLPGIRTKLWGTHILLHTSRFFYELICCNFCVYALCVYLCGFVYTRINACIHLSTWL